MNVNRFFAHENMSFRYIFLYLCVLLFALRSLIPFGYMPNMQSLAKGKIEITICSPTGPQSTVISVPVPVNHQQEHANDGMLDCPFSIVNAQGMLAGSPDASISTLNAVALAVPSLSQSQVMHVLASGPPLGSRAPPQSI